MEAAASFTMTSTHGFHDESKKQEIIYSPKHYRTINASYELAILIPDNSGHWI